MYGYPEQFIPVPEIGAASDGPGRARHAGGGEAGRLARRMSRRR